MSQHAVLAPSGAEGWMNCAGRPAMEKGRPDDPNEYSDEGTAAHLLASLCLSWSDLPSVYEYTGLIIAVGHNPATGFDGAVLATQEDSRPPFVTRREYVVDEAMAGEVAKYVNKVREYRGAGQLLVEQRVSIEPFTGEKGAAGTADAVIVLPGELQVHDLKYGMGHAVSAERNKQLMIYALGVRHRLEMVDGPFDRIRLVIHQPRLGVVDEWDCSAAELDEFAAEVWKAAGSALNLYTHPPVAGFTTPPYVYLKPTESTCLFCKAAAVCPALAQRVREVGALEYHAASELSLSEKMQAVGLVEDWCKAVRAEVERQLFAGKPVPGYKLVLGRRGSRRWSSEEQAEALLKKLRLRQDAMYDMSLRSPPAIEKLLKDHPRKWKRVIDTGLIEQRDGLPSVAPESDKRSEWAPADTSDLYEAKKEIA